MFNRHHPYWPPGLPKSLTVPRTSLYFNLQVSAKRYPQKTAIHYYGADLSYARLDAEVCALAAFLTHRCGVKKGDRVLLYMQNSPQFVIGYYAILRADAAVVPVNPMNRSEELRHYAEDSGAKVVLAGQELWTQVEPLLGSSGLAHCILGAYSDYIDPATDLPLADFVRAPRIAPSHADVTLWADALAANLSPAEHTAGPDDLAVLPYTSGTTGKPKGCMHPHSTIMCTANGGVAWYSGTSEAVILGVLPMFHVTGMQGNMNTPLILGATVVMMTRWDRDCAALLIQRQKVTSWTNITAMLIDFLANPKLDQYDLSSLTRVGGGGASMPEAVARKMEEKIGLPYLEGYGLTETAAPTHVNPVHRPKKQCAGIPYFDTDSRVVDPEKMVELGPNQVGEIISRGPQVFRGYWNQPQATKDVFVEFDGNTFFRTGDLGYYDEEGYFFITDRLKRMINASGFKVWPAEVEAMLYAHPDIQEACVIALRDAYRGETVKAVVVLKAASRGKVSPEDIIEWAKEKMAAYKYPRVVEFVAELPKTGTGKVFWRKLQEMEDAKR
ncbi:MAG: long-chain fatty acid--CoA ligase [Proteobacteria bacterium]|nr:long-chain fatty acid--CoA ligase [Pseudomonadota bacterium]